MAKDAAGDPGSRPDLLDWLDDLPPAIRDATVCIAAGPLPGDTADLRRSIDEHIDNVQQALATNEFLDIETAEQAGAAARRFVELLPQLDGAREQVALVAVHYFLSKHDAEDDLSSAIGFDDDLIVLRSAAKYLGLSQDP